MSLWSDNGGVCLRERDWKSSSNFPVISMSVVLLVYVGFLLVLNAGGEKDRAIQGTLIQTRARATSRLNSKVRSSWTYQTV